MKLAAPDVAAGMIPAGQRFDGDNRLGVVSVANEVLLDHHCQQFPLRVDDRMRGSPT
ncbi:hypothetical protein [Rhodococcus sp. 1163]|uniref:hypothetical protein n=1 Tax=Rhodococcus sp. 1163 TaxID=1905289 RepID=UPI0015C46E75|nr:hypothetical protein [Rhodococcus sp. 1163]